MSSKKKTPKEKKSLAPNKNTRWTCPLLFFYPECFGIPCSDDDLALHRVDIIHEMEHRLSQVRDYILSSGAKFHFSAKVHHADTKSGNALHFLTPAIEKPHCHIIIEGDNQTRLEYYLNILARFGIAYRLDPKLANDLSIIDSGEAMQNGVHPDACIAYLLHLTNDALNDPDKVSYDKSTLITTHTPEEIDEYLFRYKTGQRKPLKRSQRNDELQSYCNMAESAGATLDIDFNDWFIEHIPPVDRSSCKNLLLDSYNKGFTASVEKLRNNYLRCTIFIQGAPATGKTATTINALSNLSMHPLSITKGGKTGATDNYRPCYNKALVYNDTQVNDILNTCDNSISSMYKRGNGNKPNLSKFVVITSNLSFEDYLATYDAYKPEELDACKTRFYICSVDDLGYLKLKSHPTRCHGKDAVEQDALFNAFLSAYNLDRHDYLTIAKPKEIDVDTKKRAVTALCNCSYSLHKSCGHSLVCSDCLTCPYYQTAFPLFGVTRYDFITVARSLIKTQGDFALPLCLDIYEKYFREGVKI